MKTIEGELRTRAATRRGSGSSPGEPRWATRLPASNLAIFAYVLAWGLSLHLAAERDWWASPVHAATTVAALAVIRWPNSRLAFCGLAVSWVGVWAWEAPRAYNHTNLFALILVVVPFVLLSERRRVDPGGQSATEQLFPYVRALTYVLFAFAAFHKLNSDYFDPAVSCGVEHLERLADRSQVLAGVELDSVGHVFIVGSIATEIAIPVLLAMRRTRVAGLVLAFAFHYLIGFNSLWSFSAPAVALYVAFVNEGFSDRVVQIIRSSRWWLRGFVTLAVTLAGLPVVGLAAPDLASRGGLAVYVLSGPVLMALIVVGCWQVRAEYIGRLNVPLALGCLLAIVIGCSPYLGLGTRANLAMFSNLQTEGTEWNHFVVPDEAQIFGLQDNLVMLEDPSSPIMDHVDTSGLQMATSEVVGQERIVEFEFVRAVHSACAETAAPLPATFTVNGDPYAFADICSEPAWSEPHAFPLDDILRFRLVSTPSVCRQ